MASRFSLILKARRHYRKLEYPAAVDILESGNLENDAIAQFMLAEIYFMANKRETGLKKDMPRAIKHYKRSSELGYREASYELGEMYNDGFGVKPDYQKAAEYYLAAISQGHVIAKYSLADMYIDEMPEKIPQAIELLKQVIVDGEYEGLACAKLGKLYLRGNGVEKDLEAAKYYFEQGLQYDNSSCNMELAYLYFYGLGVEKNLHKALAYVESAGEDHVLYEEVKELIEKEISSPATRH